MHCTHCGTPNAVATRFCVSCGSPFTVVPVVFSTVRYAGFWLRFWAYSIDLLILAALPILLSVIIAPLFFTGPLALVGLGLAIFILPVLATEGWVYYALMETSSYQATFGKRVLGLKVTGMNGERVSFGAATIRYFAKILSHLMLNFGFIMAAFTEKKQALHDIIASCLVIRG